MERRVINIIINHAVLIFVDFMVHAALRRKSKNWLARNQDNVYAQTVVSVS
jgi:hypothetical protein